MVKYGGFVVDQEVPLTLADSNWNWRYLPRYKRQKKAKGLNLVSNFLSSGDLAEIFSIMLRSLWEKTKVSR